MLSTVAPAAAAANPPAPQAMADYATLQSMLSTIAAVGLLSLSSQQAMADYATLIWELREELKDPDAPVIGFGGCARLACLFVLPCLTSQAPASCIIAFVYVYSTHLLMVIECRSRSGSCPAGPSTAILTSFAILLLVAISFPQNRRSYGGMLGQLVESARGICRVQ